MVDHRQVQLWIVSVVGALLLMIVLKATATTELMVLSSVVMSAIRFAGSFHRCQYATS